MQNYGGYKSSCQSKKKFDSYEDARLAAKKLRKKVGARTKPYECRFCAGWHNGHDRKNYVAKVIAQQMIVGNSVDN